MSEKFIKYIKCVGTGPKLNRDLSVEEMHDAMKQILSGVAEPEQITAFLLGWRLKPETIDEYRTALAVLDRYTKKESVSDGIEIGYPFDGKANNPYIFSIAASLVEPYEIEVVVNGSDIKPSKGGATVKDICTSLPKPKNLKYFDRKEYCKALDDLTPLRQKLGLRTGFNTLEKLPNVANCNAALIGVFHKPYVKKYFEIFGDRYKRVVIVKGDKGTPEIFGKCNIWVCESGDIEEININPTDFGIEYKKSSESFSKDEILKMVSNPSQELMKIAKLNAAVWLYAKERATSIESGWEIINSL